MCGVMSASKVREISLCAGWGIEASTDGRNPTVRDAGVGFCSSMEIRKTPTQTYEERSSEKYTFLFFPQNFVNFSDNFIEAVVRLN